MYSIFTAGGWKEKRERISASIPIINWLTMVLGTMTFGGWEECQLLLHLEQQNGFSLHCYKCIFLEHWSPLDVPITSFFGTIVWKPAHYVIAPWSFNRWQKKCRICVTGTFYCFLRLFSWFPPFSVNGTECNYLWLHITDVRKWTDAHTPSSRSSQLAPCYQCSSCYGKC